MCNISDTVPYKQINISKGHYLMAEHSWTYWIYTYVNMHCTSGSSRNLCCSSVEVLGRFKVVAMGARVSAVKGEEAERLKSQLQDLWIFFANSGIWSTHSCHIATLTHVFWGYLVTFGARRAALLQRKAYGRQKSWSSVPRTPRTPRTQIILESIWRGIVENILKISWKHVKFC